MSCLEIKHLMYHHNFLFSDYFLTKGNSCTTLLHYCSNKGIPLLKNINYVFFGYMLYTYILV